MQRRTGRLALLTASIATLATGLLGSPSALAGSTAAAKVAADDGLRINQVQVVGSHNSYHLEAPLAESALRAIVAPDGQKALEYTHAALPTQFGQQQVRQIE